MPKLTITLDIDTVDRQSTVSYLSLTDEEMLQQSERHSDLMYTRDAVFQYLHEWFGKNAGRSCLECGHARMWDEESTHRAVTQQCWECGYYLSQKVRQDAVFRNYYEAAMGAEPTAISVGTYCPRFWDKNPADAPQGGQETVENNVEAE